tara:strand:- start:118 stop:267 length:150 start_codon:yes stop_codon:yes gene_type:complete
MYIYIDIYLLEIPTSNDTSGYRGLVSLVAEAAKVFAIVFTIGYSAEHRG